jgi:hypothetical protein
MSKLLWKSGTYEGISITFDAEFVAKYTPASVIGEFCLLQSSPFPRLCNRYSIYATAGPDLLETCTGWSATVPKFQ